MDFQFTPESEHNPEENLSGIVHTPGVTDFSSPHTLGEGAPLKPGIEGGALEGMGGPAKPTLHIEGTLTAPHNSVMGGGGFTKTGATPEGHTVYYDYNKAGEPLYAQVYGTGDKKGDYNPDEINFPSLAQLAPTKPVLHTGELDSSNFSPYSNPYIKGKTPDGGTIFYGYYEGNKPLSASVYDAGGSWTATHYPDSIAFPPAPKAEVKRNIYDELDVPTLHEHYATPFAYYNGFDDAKPEFEFSQPLKAVPGTTLVMGRLENGNTAYLYYDKLNGGNPSKAVEKTEDGSVVGSFHPNEINFPQHPLEQVPWEAEKPSVTLPKLSLGPKYEEEPIEELYKPKEDSSYPKAQLSAPLSRDEIESIREYTGSYYSDINHYVRNKSNLDEGSFERNEKHEDHMANLDSAIAKASLPEPVTLYRGISSTLFSKFASRLEPGETILHQNYMSTSSRHEFARAWKSGHTMILETPAGTHALPVEEHSRNSGEKEIIFPRDTRLKLVKKDSKSLYFEVLP